MGVETVESVRYAWRFLYVFCAVLGVTVEQALGRTIVEVVTWPACSAITESPQDASHVPALLHDGYAPSGSAAQAIGIRRSPNLQRTSFYQYSDGPAPAPRLESPLCRYEHSHQNMGPDVVMYSRLVVPPGCCRRDLVGRTQRETREQATVWDIWVLATSLLLKPLGTRRCRDSS